MLAQRGAGAGAARRPRPWQRGGRPSAQQLAGARRARVRAAAGGGGAAARGLLPPPPPQPTAPNPLTFPPSPLPSPPPHPPTPSPPPDADLAHLTAAAELAGASAGLTQPHPNAACVLVSPDGRVLASAFQRAHGSTPAEVLAVSEARGAAAGATAYLNLESGDCHGDDAAVAALIQAGVSRAVVGLRHPLRHLRNRAVAALRAAGVRADVLGSRSSGALPGDAATEAALLACLRANEGLLHRAALRRPMSVLKYAMTLDGKIATTTGHAAWVSSAASRARVFEMRARSDAVLVGGNTVRRDNPNLTTRRCGAGWGWRGKGPLAAPGRRGRRGGACGLQRRRGAVGQRPPWNLQPTLTP
jgi:pyrimidine deaminase RibD-like protein